MKRWIIASLFIILFIVVLFFVFENKIVYALDPYLPKDHGKTLPYYFDLFRLAAAELLWCGLILVFVLLLYHKPLWQSPFHRIDRWMVSERKIFVRSVISLSVCAILFTAFIVLQQFANSSDEYVYLYQAETLIRGNLWEEAHTFEKSFGFNHIAVKDGIMVGRFPIGWPLIIAVFLFIGVPAALINPLLATLTLIVFYRFARKLYGDRTAGWATMLIACSGFFMFNSSSFFSHTSCLLETLLFVYCIYLFFEKQEMKYAFLAGLTLGLIMLIRYYTAVLLFLPFFVVILYHHGWKSFRLFIPMGIAAVPSLLLFLWYNNEVTGNPLTPVTVWGYQNEGLGFVNGHSPLNGLEHIIRRFMMFVYWCSPVLLVMYGIYLFDKVRHRKSRVVTPEDYFFLSFIIGYFFYYEIGGNQYGPRFYYEAFPFMMLFVVHKVFHDDRYTPKLFLYAAFAVMLLKFPFIAYREHAIVDERQNVYDLVREKGITNAVVLISTGTSVTRPMPIGDLTRNDMEFQNNVLYAMDKEQFNKGLMDFYRHRSFYKYMRKPGRKDGILVKIR